MVCEVAYENNASGLVEEEEECGAASQKGKRPCVADELYLCCYFDDLVPHDGVIHRYDTMFIQNIACNSRRDI